MMFRFFIILTLCGLVLSSCKTVRRVVKSERVPTDRQKILQRFADVTTDEEGTPNRRSSLEGQSVDKKRFGKKKYSDNKAFRTRRSQFGDDEYYKKPFTSVNTPTLDQEGSSFQGEENNQAGDSFGTETSLFSGEKNRQFTSGFRESDKVMPTRSSHLDEPKYSKKPKLIDGDPNAPMTMKDVKKLLNKSR